jgi:hypothetical protein
MRRFLVCIALCGCARAGEGNSIIGGITDAAPRTDARDFPSIDAAVIDAPPQQVTLTQTSSETITAGNTFACRNTVTDVTLENHYYRLFALADHGVKGMLHLTQVDFGVELADGGPSSTTQPATINLGVYGGKFDATTTTIDLAMIRSLATADIKIPDGVGKRVTVPITADVAAGSVLTVELVIPDGTTAQSSFLIGSNGQGERRPGFTLATACAVTPPKTMAAVAKDIGVGEADIILSATGTQ